MTVEGEPFLAAAFSNGKFVWSSTKDEGHSQYLDLGSPVSAITPKQGGLLLGCVDGSMHFVDTGKVREVEQLDREPEIEFEEDIMLIGDVELTISHYD